ncbi:hypothetical protein [Halosimplex sp. TS25]|uniref:hypothetical protein n=1 Tax=Halosimplex rarum TaxID=3396619 RepID=UPI0039E7F3D4
MRAYVAHAKETCFPVIEDEEFAKRLKEFFVGFRAGADGQESDSPVPVTFRQVEAIQRIAESSARVRLSDTVEMQDIERAVDLVMESMKEVGYDPESGEFDVDIIETGQSKSQRDRREEIISAIEEVGGATKNEISDLVSFGESYQIEHDIEQLQERGRIYEMEGELNIA